MTAFDERLRATFGDARVLRDVPLAPLTTFRVGGPADWLLTLSGARGPAAAALAAGHQVPLTVLGGGSNVLVADTGLRGLVVRVHGGEVARSARGAFAPTGA